MIIIVSYFPWIIIDKWKSNTYVNCYVWLVLLDSRSQFLTSHVIFNRRAYTQRVDWIVFCKSSSFFICDVASRGTFPTPQALRPNTYNNCFETSFTKVGFGNFGNCSTTITNLSHSRYALTQTRLATFWSFRLCTVVAFPKMRAFILTWFWCWGPPIEVEGLPSLAFFCHQAMHLIQMVNNHLAQYVTM